jgi:BlaI family penicillinase repressor
MPPKISSAEWEVMNVLWSKGPSTAVEIFEALPSGHGWKQKTVNTFLTRLTDKRAVTADKRERAHVYSARVSREKSVRRATWCFTSVLRLSSRPRKSANWSNS